MKQAIVTIPHGFSNNGSWLCKAKVRQLNGYDQQYLVEEIWSYPSPIRTTNLLERVVKFVGVGDGLEVVEELDLREIIRSLTVGDRIALLMQLRKLTFGDQMQCNITCPSCKEVMSLDLSTSKLLQPPIPEPKSEYTINVENFLLTIRPVAGKDQESLFENYDDNNSDNNLVENKNDRFVQAERLTKGCILSSTPSLPNNFTDDFIAMTSSKLEELDPQADVVLELCCPSCQHSFKDSLDIENFFFQEIYTSHKQIEREVHWMALNYHWSEDSILSLPLRKRKRYIELINGTLSGENI
jgi:hypothetical protein